MQVHMCSCTKRASGASRTHFRACTISKFSGGVPPPPHTHNPFCGALLFVFALGPPNPLGGPAHHPLISSASVLPEPRPSNSWRAKVSNYGSVNLLQRVRTVTPGDPTYAAPEAENAAVQSPKVDIFSFGVPGGDVYSSLS